MPSVDEYFIIGILHTTGGSSTGLMFLDSNLAMHIKNLDNIYHFWLSNFPSRNLEGSNQTQILTDLYK